MIAGDLATARTVLIEAVDGWRARGETQKAGGALAVLGRAYWQSGEGERATEAIEEAIALLGEKASPELVQAYNWASAGHMLSGRYAEGREFAERGLALAEELDLRGLRSHLLNTLGVCEVNTGDPNGVRRIEEALTVGLESGEPEAIGRAYVNLCDTLGKTGRFREAVDVAEEGRVATRKLGAPAMEWFIAGNEAYALVLLGRYEEADLLTREMLEEQRAVLGAPGLANAGYSRVGLLVRRGLHAEARALSDENLSISRGLGGSEFLGQGLLSDAELELARGNNAAARQALREAVQLATEEDLGHLVPMLPAAARLLAPEEVEQLLERVSTLPGIPLNEAQRREAQAVLADDAGLFLEAAALYRAVEMPYEEARCRAAAGEEEVAAAIYERLGVPAPART
jgi:tetratricopeptide (TPR) repeat protein